MRHFYSLCSLAIQFFIFSLLMTGCTDSAIDFDKLNAKDGKKLINRSTQWVVPALSTELRLADYVDITGNSHVLMDDVGNYVLSVVDTLYQRRASDFVTSVTVPPTSQGIPVAAIPPSSTEQLDTFVDVDIAVDPTGLQLKEVEFSGGQVIFNVVNNTDARLRFEFILPSLTKPIVVYLDVDKGQTARQSARLEDASVYMAGASAQRYNRMRVSMKVTNMKTIEEAVVGTGTLNIEFDNVAWSFMRGYLGTLSYAIPPLVRFTQINNRLGGGLIVVKNARSIGSYYEIITINEMGVPFFIESLVSFYRPSDNLQDKAFRSVPIRLYDQYPTIDMRGQGTEYTQRYGVNQQLDTILSFLPNRYTHQGSIVANRGRSARIDTNQFVNFSSTYTILGKLFLPFRFAEIDTIYIEDEISSNITEIDTTTFIVDTATLYVQGSNSFPIEMNLSLFFLDSDGNHYDTLTLTTPIASAAVDDGGYVVSAKAFSSIVELDKAAIRSLDKLRSIIVRATLRKKYDRVPISFSSKNFITIGLGLKAAVRTKL